MFKNKHQREVIWMDLQGLKFLKSSGKEWKSGHALLEPPGALITNRSLVSIDVWIMHRGKICSSKLVLKLVTLHNMSCIHTLHTGY